MSPIILTSYAHAEMKKIKGMLANEMSKAKKSCISYLK